MGLGYTLFWASSLTRPLLLQHVMQDRNSPGQERLQACFWLFLAPQQSVSPSRTVVMLPKGRS